MVIGTLHYMSPEQVNGSVAKTPVPMWLETYCRRNVYLYRDIR